MADELSRWRQPGWGNYKRASKPPPAAAKEGEERKKVWPLLLLFAPSNCPLNRSIFALPPDRRLCETNSLGIFRKLQSQSTRGLYRSRSASPGFSRRQPAIRSTAPLGRWGSPRRSAAGWSAPLQPINAHDSMSAGLQLAFLQALSH